MSRFIDALKENGVNIDFKMNLSGQSRLKHDSKEYYFYLHELDGAHAYISYLVFEDLFKDEFRSLDNY